MSLKKSIGKIFPVVDSARRKEMVIQGVQNSPQLNSGVINIHRYNPNNVGDYYCGPHHYFEKLRHKVLDIYGFREISKKKRTDWINSVNQHSLIIGGGGLLNIRHFQQQMQLFQTLKAKGKKTVLWGLGHNETDRSKFGKVHNYNIDPSKFGLVGTRDFSMKTEWVPCVSCLHDIFDQKYEVTQETGIIFSNKTLKDKRLLANFKHYPSTSNTTNLEDMVSFIGASSTIVTDSYHAMYWAILMGKKVLVIPTTSKFYDFKFPPVITSFNEFENDLNKATRYSGVLEECREINVKFAEKVFDYLEI